MNQPELPSFFAQIIGTVIALLVVLVPILWRLRGTIDKIINGVAAAVEVPTTKAADKAGAAAVAVYDFSEKLTGILDRQTQSQQMTQQYLIEANTSLRQDRDLQKLKTEEQAQKIGDLTLRLNTYVETVEGLLKGQDERVQATRERDERIEALSEKVAAMESALSGTKQALAETQAELVQAQSDLLETRTNLAKAEQRIQELEHQHATELDRARSEKADLERQLDQERTKVKDLEGKVKTLQDQVKDLQAQLEARKLAEQPPSLLNGEGKPAPDSLVTPPPAVQP